MKKSAVDTSEPGTSYQLKNIKVHDAFNIKGKVSAYWDVEKAGIADLSLTYIPKDGVVVFAAPGIKTIWIPLANIPFMTPLED
jgi:hypothetical protein